MDAALLDRPDAMTPREDGQPSIWTEIQAVRQEAEADHKRLRFDVTEVERRLLIMENAQAKLSQLAEAPTDLSRITMTPRAVAGIVIFCLGMAASQWASTYGLRSDVRDILTRQEERSKLEEERQSNNRVLMNEVRQRVDLLSIQVQQFEKSMLDKRGAR